MSENERILAETEAAIILGSNDTIRLVLPNVPEGDTEKPAPTNIILAVSIGHLIANADPELYALITKQMQAMEAAVKETGE